MPPEQTGHERIDKRSLALHRAVAAKLRTQPELVQVALKNIDRWYPDAGSTRACLDEWRRILDQPLDSILATIVEEGERMTALRQSTPFSGILDPKERWAIYRQFKGEVA